METKEWLEKRKQCITATDISKICGLSKWGTAFDVWFKKTSDDVQQVENMAMAKGLALEPIIAKRYSEKYNLEVTKGEFVSKDINGVPCGCTPDYISSDNRINVEVKTSAYGIGWGDEGTDEIPDEYFCQVQWQMGVLGIEITHIPHLRLTAKDIDLYVVKFDKAFFDKMLEKASVFWGHVVSKTPPPVDGSGSARVWLTKKIGAGSKQLITEPSQVLKSSVVKYAKLRRILDFAESKMCVLENVILEQTSGFSGVKIDGVGKISVISGRTQERSDYKGMWEKAKQHIDPEIAKSIEQSNKKQYEVSASLRFTKEKE